MLKYQKFLKEQSSVKVVLNGGSSVLEDATVPFMLGFGPEIADRKPTHVMIITLHYSTYLDCSDLDDAKRWCRNQGERQIVEISQMGYLQFHKPGLQNVMFVLLSYVSKEAKKEFLQKRSLSNYYYNSIFFDEIDCNGVEGIKIVGHCEEIIDVPKEFFAVLPKNGFKKHWWSWVNRWWETDPIDQCEFRKRAIIATTIQPVCWFLGFLLRFVFAMVSSAIWITISFVAFLGGSQIKTSAFLSRLYILNWEFLFLFRKTDWGDVTEKDFWSKSEFWFDFKEYKTAKWLYNIPISPLGLCIQVVMWSFYLLGFYQIFFLHEAYFSAAFMGAVGAFIGTWHLCFVVSTMQYEAVDQWVAKTFGEKESQKIRNVWKIIISLISAVLLSALFVWMPWVATGKFIAKAFFFILGYWKIASFIAFVLLFKFVGKKILKQYYEKTSTVLILIWLFFLLFLMLSPSILKQGGWKNISFTWQHWTLIGIGLYILTSYIGGKKIKKFWSFVWGKISKINFYTQQNPREFLPRKEEGSYVSNSLGLKEWYKKYMSLEAIPEKITPKQSVIAPTAKATFVLRFKISFWRKKAKACKPYVKE